MNILFRGAAFASTSEQPHTGAFRGRQGRHQ